MSIVAYAGTGTLLSVENTGVSPIVFRNVANIKSLGGIKLTRTRLDTSTHNYAATQSGYDDFILGLKHGGSFPITVIYDPNDASHDDSTLGLRGLYESGAKVNMKVTLGNVSPACYFPFVAAVSEIGIVYDLDGVLMQEGKIEISGAVLQNP